MLWSGTLHDLGAQGMHDTCMAGRQAGRQDTAALTIGLTDADTRAAIAASIFSSQVARVES